MKISGDFGNMVQTDFDTAEFVGAGSGIAKVMKALISGSGSAQQEGSWTEERKANKKEKQPQTQSQMRALHFRQYSAQSSALASKNIAIQLQGDLARIRSRWTAHSEAICDVTLMDKVSAVLTSSLDKCVHIWSLDGSRLKPASRIHNWPH